MTPDAIAQAIRHARENPKRLQEMSACAAPAESFGLDLVGRQWLDVFELKHGDGFRTMKRRHKATFVTIVPSPYQRDLFAALAARDDVELDVYYMEAESPNSPWPEKPLRSFERIMPGFWVPFGGARGHVSWGLPDPSRSDVIVLSSFTSLTGQYLMRGASA